MYSLALIAGFGSSETKITGYERISQSVCEMSSIPYDIDAFKGVLN